MSTVVTERYIFDTSNWESYFAIYFSTYVETAKCVICDSMFTVTSPLKILMISGVLCGYNDVCRKCAPRCAPVLSSLMDILYARGDLRSTIKWLSRSWEEWHPKEVGDFSKGDRVREKKLGWVGTVKARIFMPEDKVDEVEVYWDGWGVDYRAHAPKDLELYHKITLKEREAEEAVAKYFRMHPGRAISQAKRLHLLSTELETSRRDSANQGTPPA